MALNRVYLKTELCIVGGGIAGICAAITASRLGTKVVLVHERPVFGGNASGEIRMWICGTQDYAYKETGLNEEINLSNYYFNPTKNYYLWNSLLYEKVVSEPNITPLLNCTCFDAETKDGSIVGITAYQMTTQKIYEICADNFIDCSGDSILAPLTGAEFRYGREAKDEFNEPMKSHTDRDTKTMGNSCLLQARNVGKKVAFRAPDWAEKVSVEKLKSKSVNIRDPYENFWYIEIGGTDDVVGNAEVINRRLLAIALGVWDTIKNSGEFDADDYELEFLGFLPAKRESRRMVGDYILNANDIIEGRIFEDTVAYGGWPLDDHNPDGFDGDKSNYTIVVPPAYGIPYRCLYSKNIKNLFFAGRNISLTHMAMSSARVMATCGTIGQAAGAAGHLASKYRISPRDVGKHIVELQQKLLNLDCFLPGVDRNVAEICKAASFDGGDVLRNGRDRDLAGQTNGAMVTNGRTLEYSFDIPTAVNGVKIVFDSDLKRESFGGMHECEKHHSMRCSVNDDSPVMYVPLTLAKRYSVEYVTADGTTVNAKSEERNLCRNVLINIGKEVLRVKLTVYGNWGNTDTTKLFTFELL